MKIAADFDDCIADQTAIMLPLMNWKLGTDFKYEDITWDFFNKDKATEEAFWAVHNLYDSTNLRRAMPPTDPYAPAVLKELQRNGNKVEVVTRNRPESREKIKAWLFMHGLDIRVRAIGRAGGQAGGKARLPYDVFIDDAPGLAEEMARHPSKRLILFSRPWNKGVKTTRNVFRAENWLEVREILRRLGA